MRKQFKNSSNADFGYDNNMGFSFDLFSKNYQAMTDMNVGLDYLTKFFASPLNSGSRDPNAYIAQMAKKYGATKVNTDIAGLGLGIKLAELSESSVQASADNLASVAGGRVPSSIADFRQSLVNQATSTPFTDAVLESAIVQNTAIVGDTLIDLAQSAGSIAKSSVEAVGTGAKLIAMAPWLFGGLAVYGIYKVISSDFVKSTAKGLINKRLGV